MRLIVLFVVVCVVLVAASSRRRYPLEKEYDFVVIGAGPAGLQYALFLERYAKPLGYTYIVLERGGAPGTFFRRAPWDRRLISVNKVHVGGVAPNDDFCLRHDWHSLLDAPYRMRDVTHNYFPMANEFVTYLEHCAADLHVHYDVSVESIASKILRIRHRGGRITLLRARSHVIVATGYAPKSPPERLRMEARRRRIPIYTYPNIPPATHFVGKEVAVYGSGNAACEVASRISQYTARMLIVGKPPRLAATSQYSGGVRMRNLAFLDQYLLKSLDVSDMDRRTNSQTVPPPHLMTPDAIIFCGGFRAQRFDDDASEAKFPCMGPFWTDARDASVCYAGVAMHATDFQVSSGGFVHGFRYLIRAQFRHLRAIAGGALHRPWPRRRFASAAAVYKHVRWRIQHSSGLYQMHSTLCDVLVCEEGAFWIYEEVPLMWKTMVVPATRAKRHICIGFFYGSKVARPWQFEYLFDMQRTRHNLFLHPAFQFHEDSNTLCKIGEVPEDPRSAWKGQTFDIAMFAGVCEAIQFVRTPRPS